MAVPAFRAAKGVTAGNSLSIFVSMDLSRQMRQLAERSRQAGRALAKLDSAAKNRLLLAMAEGIERAAGTIDRKSTRLNSSHRT